MDISQLYLCPYSNPKFLIYRFQRVKITEILLKYKFISPIKSASCVLFDFYVKIVITQRNKLGSFLFLQWSHRLHW